MPRGFASRAGTVRKQPHTHGARAESKASDGVSGSGEKGMGSSSPPAPALRSPQRPLALAVGLTSACITGKQVGIDAIDAF